MRIERIEIKDFRGFPGIYELKLGRPGHNLLVYGENGSGKSSLFQALRLFFASSEFTGSIQEYRNEFTKSDEVLVKLELVDYDGQGNRDPASGTFEWSPTASPHGQPLIQEANKTKGCLDYRALLETHYVHRDEGKVELFKLLETVVLGHVENPISKKAFRTELAEIRDMVRKDWRTWSEALDSRSRNFNKGFENVLDTVEQKANELLTRFFPDTQIHLKPTGALARSGTGRNKGLIFPKVHLAATSFGLHRDDLHHFLNEARLSAIAISLYLASLLIVPASRLRLLVLDDLLIGIDMSNRIALLNILREEFNGWQIILLTHDRVWYETVRMSTLYEKTWWYAALHAETSAGGVPTPLWRGHEEGWIDNLDRARQHLANHDDRAAGVYARAAFEGKLKSYCEKKSVAVQFKNDPAKMTTEMFWTAIKGKLTGPELAEIKKQVDDIEIYRKIVLNPLSHEHPTTLTTTEIQGAITAIDALDQVLK
ncbi:MAG: ATP-binding protein [Nitrosospira sp.]|nr:ATP-binding protein [Nitrosospira sp.]